MIESSLQESIWEVRTTAATEVLIRSEDAIFACTENEVRCIDLASGGDRGKTPIPCGLVIGFTDSTWLVQLTGTDPTKRCGVDRDSGRALWTHAAVGIAAAANDESYVFSVDRARAIVVIDSRTGQEKWRVAAADLSRDASARISSFPAWVPLDGRGHRGFRGQTPSSSGAARGGPS